jgi:hypothetical protein
LKSLQDALYNWLTIKVVYDARPFDESAKDTLELFNEILKDHQVEDVEVVKDEVMYELFYRKDNEQKSARFPVELIDIMINQIEEEPEKYPNYAELEKNER